mmetsp:Transcript_5068/g.9418  ORF Transcript_5068/g.9418 Transcript_5068/m.9418 type:complete len:151 (-) Transcript_5068:84-536(-)
MKPWPPPAEIIYWAADSPNLRGLRHLFIIYGHFHAVQVLSFTSTLAALAISSNAIGLPIIHSLGGKQQLIISGWFPRLTALVSIVNNISTLSHSISSLLPLRRLPFLFLPTVNNAISLASYHVSFSWCAPKALLSTCPFAGSRFLIGWLF